MVSADAAAKVRQLTGAKVIVAGQVIQTNGNHLVALGSIIGTENARLLAVQAEDSADHLLDLANKLSELIAQKITAQASDLVAVPAAGTNTAPTPALPPLAPGAARPSVAVKIWNHDAWNLDNAWRSTPGEVEFGAILLKAGFTVVDDKSDRPPDIIINAGGEFGSNGERGGLTSATYLFAVQARDRRTGRILAFDNQQSTATNVGYKLAQHDAVVKTMNDLAERLAPVLAK